MPIPISQIGDTIGGIAANRADLGRQTLPISVRLSGERRYLTVAYTGARATASQPVVVWITQKSEAREPDVTYR